MAFAVHPPEVDLIGTDPGGHDWEPHSVHTHYFGFQVPEAGIGGFLYIRYQPYFPLSQGTVIIFEGTDNAAHLDIAHLDWQMAMPYPVTEGNVITTANGFRVEFLELGQTARLTYASGDGRTSFDLLQEAFTPLIARGAVIPGENLHESHEPGGFEQYMHVTGSLTLAGVDHAVDCYMPRDRSWRQSRTEVRGGRHDPPVAWTPIYFPDTGLAFNQVGFEAPDSDPVWAGHLNVPDGMPGFHFGFVHSGGGLREITSVRRAVQELHPQIHAPMRQTIAATDDAGSTYEFTGETVAIASIPSWPNAATWDSVVRWTDAGGNVGHGPCQGIWYDAFQHLMKELRSGR
ncbi:MAG: hypothetical protein QOF76_160 [Solirubrobacteraceae bacterium]|nr:hypothetical protein [Solirubrobacteraceae bacterium]